MAHIMHRLPHMFDFKKYSYCDLEIRVYGSDHSRYSSIMFLTYLSSKITETLKFRSGSGHCSSLKVIPLDSLPMVSYWRPIYTVSQKKVAHHTLLNIFAQG